MPKLWVTDDDIIKESGVPEDKMRAVLGKLDRDRLSGFPKKNPLYDNRRYWPAVLAYWDITNPVPRPRQSHDLERKIA